VDEELPQIEEGRYHSIKSLTQNNDDIDSENDLFYLLNHWNDPIFFIYSIWRISCNINNIIDNMSLKDFQIISQLGEGAYSTVYRVKRLIDNQEYAMKKVKMDNLSEK